LANNKFERELKTKYDATTSSGNYVQLNTDNLFNPSTGAAKLALNVVLSNEASGGVSHIASAQSWNMSLTEGTGNPLDQLPANLKARAEAGRLVMNGLDFSDPFLIKNGTLWAISGYTNTAGANLSAATVAGHIKDLLYLQVGKKLAEESVNSSRSSDASTLENEYNNTITNTLE